MIVTADLHLKEESEVIVLDQFLPTLVQLALTQIDRRVAILGDVYHVRYRVAVHLQNRLFDFLDKSGVQWVVIPGNHDQINDAGDHALEVFRELDNVEVISEPTWNAWGLWIPYRKRPADIERALTMTKPEGCPPIAWMHHGVRGAWMNNNIRDQEGIPLDKFGGFRRVYCGHYHKPQELGNVLYIGSPYQTRADEAGQDKFVGIWDGGSPFEMRLYQVNCGRRFQRFTMGPNSMPDLSQFGKTDELRVQVEDQDPEEVGRFLAGQGFTNVVVTPVQKAREARLQVDPTQGVAAYAQGYVEQFAGELDIQRLMALYQEITG